MTSFGEVVNEFFFNLKIRYLVLPLFNKMLDESQYSFSMHFVHMNVPNSYERLVFMLFLSLKWGQG